MGKHITEIMISCLVLTLYVIFTGTAHAACMQQYVTIPTDPNRFNNAWNVATKKVMTDHEHRCEVGGRTCQSTSGYAMCAGVMKPCKTLFVPTSGMNGKCSCGCAQL